jgi:uncharacterized protein (DUF362 family)
MAVANEALGHGADGLVWVTHFREWPASVRALLDAAHLPDLLLGVRRILIKPNLVQALAPPITTPLPCVASLVDYLRERAPLAELMVGEGVGAADEDTPAVFAKLGYLRWAAQAGIKLVDLNHEPLVRKAKPGCSRWPDFFLPQLLFDTFVISVPVLKAHTLARVTLSMKNMMGCAPPAYYQQGDGWKKGAFHARIQEAVFDLNQYRTPDFTLLDATVGMAEAHLWGPTCQPPPRQLVAGRDPVAVDVYGAMLLGRDWRQVGHLRMAHGVLGCAEPLEVIEVDDVGH